MKQNAKQNEMIKQIFEYNRKGVEAIFEATEQIQGKAEALTGQAVEDAGYVPEQGKAFVKQWIETGRKARLGLKEALLKGQEQIERLMTPA